MNDFASCRGTDKKKELVVKYDIKPVSYLKLLNGQTISGCCGKLTDNYYVFEAIKRKEAEAGSFYFKVGKDCAEQFLTLINHEPLKLFNPLRAAAKEQDGARNENNNTTKVDVPNRPNFTEVNRELLNSINLLLSAWQTFPKLGLKAIIDYTIKNPQTDNLRGIEIFNKILASDGRKMNKIIEELRELNPTLRDFSFNKMHDYLIKKKIISNLYDQ